MKIDRICEDNPDLSRQFVFNILLSEAEVCMGFVAKYEFQEDDEAEAKKRPLC